MLTRTNFYSYALTDPSKDGNDAKTIWLCPLFFTGDDTKNDLPNTEDENRLKTWCNQKDYTSLTTGGK